ncbi:ATP-grasp domain-containing protein [Photorhabdus laumondii]|uniref:ATP-grasp domain-containing protein n=1 Tax=Photorhabdus laumondii TaxID=2218628 RepID=UPI0025B0FC46|nr:hypothetical protein [Photorhabdus laumondii]
MSVLILYRERTEDVVKLLNRLTASGVLAWAASPNDLSLCMKGGQTLELYLGAKLIVPRLVFGWVSLQARELGLSLLQAFERSGIPVLNNASVLSEGQNKLINSVVLHHHGYSHADTIVVTNELALERLLCDVGLPCVVKPLVGAKGMDVRRIDNLPELFEYARTHSLKTKLSICSVNS